MEGYIFIGYPGIGKSTIGGFCNCIDFESGNFWYAGQRDANWYRAYCASALSIANQGYSVMVSSHDEVYEFLHDCLIKDKVPENVGGIAVICPDKGFRDEWIERLRKRYDETGLKKDYKAFDHAKDHFLSDIEKLQRYSDVIPVFRLDSFDYSLEHIIGIIRLGWLLK